MALPLLVAFALTAAPPVPSDCQVDQSHDVAHTLQFVETRCAGEKVVYLCSEQKCVKDPCGGYEGDAPSLVGVGSPSRASGGKRSKASPIRSAKRSHGKLAATSADELPALFTRGPEHALQVVSLSVSNGAPTCHLVRGLDEASQRVSPRLHPAREYSPVGIECRVRRPAPWTQNPSR